MTTHENGSLDTPEERRLAGRLAGVLFLSAAVGVLTHPAAPGGGTDHWPWLIGIAAACTIWGALCLWVIRFENVPRAVFWVPGLLALVSTGVVMACTGGAHSPARFYCFFVLVFGAYFLGPREAYVYIAGCVAVHASPLFYDSGGQYVGELMVMSTAYVLLGVLLLRGKGLLVELRAKANEQALHDPLTEPPQPARDARVAGERARSGREARAGGPRAGGPRRLQGREHRARLPRGRPRALRDRARARGLRARRGHGRPPGRRRVRGAGRARDRGGHARAVGARAGGHPRPRAADEPGAGPPHGQRRLGDVPQRRGHDRRPDRHRRRLHARREGHGQGPRAERGRLGVSRRSGSAAGWWCRASRSAARP